MRLYWYGLRMLVKKFILRQNTGQVVCWFAEHMGVVYVKMAQILAMQNYGQIFTENDRQHLAEICDHCSPIAFRKIRRQIEQAYQCPLAQKFHSIDPQPLGSASISQVHRATLLSGEEVVIKVRRKDVARRVQHDVRQLRRLIHRFSRFTKLRNLLGSDQALDLWAEWIESETDFAAEQRNLLRYQAFIDSVNGKIRHTKHLKVPKLYTEFCNDEIIVMEFIAAPTVNQLEHTITNHQRIAKSINDYLQLSFYALLHDLPVVFHGDPHAGNLYLDPEGNLGFLDFGLIFELSTAESAMVRELFLKAYRADAEGIIELLLNYSKTADFDRTALTADVLATTQKFHSMPVTHFFVEMINVFVSYNVSPPPVLFKMAKAFMALYGINNYTANFCDTESLLVRQVTEYYLRRTARDFHDVLNTGLQLVPNIFSHTLRDDPISVLTTQISALQDFVAQLSKTSDHCHEALGLLNSSIKFNRT